MVRRAHYRPPRAARRRVRGCTAAGLSRPHLNTTISPAGHRAYHSALVSSSPASGTHSASSTLLLSRRTAGLCYSSSFLDIWGYLECWFWACCGLATKGIPCRSSEHPTTCSCRQSSTPRRHHEVGPALRRYSEHQLRGVDDRTPRGGFLALAQLSPRRQCADTRICRLSAPSHACASAGAGTRHQRSHVTPVPSTLHRTRRATRLIGQADVPRLNGDR